MTYELIVKVRRKGSGRDRSEYKNSVCITDPSLLALIFNDLINLYNLPFWKVVKRMKKKQTLFPISPSY